jgi:hypothetical protein
MDESIGHLEPNEYESSRFYVAYGLVQVYLKTVDKFCGTACIYFQKNMI